MKFLFFAVSIFSFKIYSQTTYNDVAGIFWNKCATCHNPNGNGQFNLTNYSETISHLSAIQVAIISNEMPPWQPDTNYTRFSNEKILTSSEKYSIIDWINNGGIEGDASLLPSSPIFPKYKISQTPDKIVKIPNFLINSTPIHDAYDIFAIPLNLPSKKVVRAIEIVPNVPDVVHHVVVTVDTTMNMQSDLSGSAYGAMGQIALSGSLTDPVIYPNSHELKTGVSVPANSQLYVQMHYSESSGGITDSTEFRLYFYPDNEPNIREIYIMVPLENWYFWVDPEEIKTIEVDSTQFNTFDVSIFSSLPHSHKICSEVTNYAYSPTTNDTIPLIKIKNWDFHHQDYYYYKNLVHIPPGYRYKGIHKFDNTSQNPNNPFNPAQLITVGLNSNDEMFFDAFQWLVYYPGDENINIDSILTNDPLITASIEKLTYSVNWTHSFVFPNPIDQLSTLQIINSNNQIKNYSIEIYDIVGKLISVKESTLNSIVINKHNLQSGNYNYTVKESNQEVDKGKFIIN